MKHFIWNSLTQKPKRWLTFSRKDASLFNSQSQNRNSPLKKIKNKSLIPINTIQSCHKILQVVLILLWSKLQFRSQFKKKKWWNKKSLKLSNLVLLYCNNLSHISTHGPFLSLLMLKLLEFSNTIKLSLSQWIYPQHSKNLSLLNTTHHRIFIETSIWLSKTLMFSIKQMKILLNSLLTSSDIFGGLQAPSLSWSMIKNSKKKKKRNDRDLRGRDLRKKN